MIKRFEACAVHSGTDIEFAREATKEARAALKAAGVNEK
jgi:hypothetical protein